MKYGICGLAWSVGLLLSLMGCGNRGKAPLDNPSRGEITIAADESFRPLVTQLTSAYSGIYPNTKFNIVYKPEQEAINYMLNDSARLVFATRQLNKNEQAGLDQQKIKGAAEKIATDGVALIINRANTDSLITMDELRAVLPGVASNGPTYKEVTGADRLRWYSTTTIQAIWSLY